MEQGKLFKSAFCCIGVAFILLGLIVVVGTFTDSNMLPTDHPIQINNQTFYLDNKAKIQQQDETGCIWKYDYKLKGSLHKMSQKSLWEYTTNYTDDAAPIINIKKNHTITHTRWSRVESYNVLFYRNKTLYNFEIIPTDSYNEKEVQHNIANFISINNITEFYE